MTMQVNLQKEEFSLAYIRAVATVAGYHTSRLDFDQDSVDLLIASVGSRGTSRSPRLEIQAKCTSQNLASDETIAFPLPIKNYDDLRSDVLVPRILIIVTVPDDIGDWIDQSEQQLIIRHCGYWVSLKGRPDTDNTECITVQVPRSQIFSPNALRSIMSAVSNGGHI
jgi:hypothetical protein